MEGTYGQILPKNHSLANSLLAAIRYSKALQSFTHLRPSPLSMPSSLQALIAARDFIYTHFQLNAERQLMEERRNAGQSATERADLRAQLADVAHTSRGDSVSRGLYFHRISKTNYSQRLTQIFKDPRSRRALVCSTVAMASQQLSGI